MKKLDFKRRVFAIVCIVVCLCVSVVPSFAYIDENHPVRDFDSFAPTIRGNLTNEDIEKLPDYIDKITKLGLMGNLYPIAIGFQYETPYLLVYCVPRQAQELGSIPRNYGAKPSTEEGKEDRLYFYNQTGNTVQATTFAITVNGTIANFGGEVGFYTQLYPTSATSYDYIAFYREVGSTTWIATDYRINATKTDPAYSGLFAMVDNYAAPMDTQLIFDEGYSSGFEAGYAEALASIPNNTNGLGGVTNDFVNLLTGGISGLASGIGSGANGFVRDLFLAVGEDGSITGLSTFGGVVAVFGGVALAVGLTTLIFNWIRNRGG